MRKYGWILIVGVVLSAVLLLMRETEPAVSPAVESQDVDLSPPVETPALNESKSAPQTDASGRLLLPAPELMALNPRLVPAHLHPLFGWKDIGGYVPRRRFVEAIDHELSPDEVRALLLFARSRPGDVGLSDADFNGVGDVVLLKLEEQKVLPAEYTDHLAIMFYDESLNAQWRDYCIQHIGTVYSRTLEEKRPLIRQLYEDALKPGSPFTGTTLLSMQRSAGTADLPGSFVAKRAMEVASSSAYADAERLSALHVAAKFNHPEALGLARQIVTSKQTAVFRAASLAILGAQGDASDRPLLEKYSNSSDIRLRVAATEALNKLNRK
jgi:hypothetical protein